MVDPSTLNLTPVEHAALAQSPHEAIYPGERIPTMTVAHFPALGRLAALRFLEWVQENPEGVCALPTGKTPEYFIHWVMRLAETWHDGDTQELLGETGLDPARKPDLSGLRFVQIDEFYPMNPTQENSFFHYVNRFYLEGFGLDPARALLIDCSRIGLAEGEMLKSVWPDDTVDLGLRYRPGEHTLQRRQKAVLERIDQWCQDYEDRIRAMGGLGFFLGGIGPDGHIGFNVRGSDHHSTTRLTQTNYMTQAAAATDLGGIEVARRRLVITIGLGTLTYNPACTAVIIAAGAAKAGLVADAVTNEPNVLYPGTALQRLTNARFYVTLGASEKLPARRPCLTDTAQPMTEAEVERTFVDLAVARNKRVADLTEDDLQSDPCAAAAAANRSETFPELLRLVQRNLETKIDEGTETLSRTRFLHTEPHHDDVMLGYLPYVVRHVRDSSNHHTFACLTGGFTSVTNGFMLEQMKRLQKYIDTMAFADLMAENYFEPDDVTNRNRDVWQYLDGVAAGHISWKDEGIARRMLRNLVEVFGERDPDHLHDRLNELVHYFETQYPGKKDPDHIQQLKSMNREWEAECLWGYFGWSCENVVHMRLGFYTGDIFTPEPTVDRDVLPVVRLLDRVEPDIVTVALDPEASGPDTHYKVMQIIAEALRRYVDRTGRTDIRVWGYRNVWYRFHPADVNIAVPVTLNMFSIMRSAFLNTFNSQRDASFPSYAHDGPFCDLAQRIQVEQYHGMKVCLGREWFHDHKSALMRATRGLVYIKELTLDAFYAHARALQERMHG